MSTLEYYNSNAKQFVDGSINADMSDHYKHFLKYLSDGCRILDLGCGSGRDTAFFRARGYIAVPTDGSKEICSLAERVLLTPVRCLRFEDLDYEEEFDGIWACASLLHVNRENMLSVLSRVWKALRHDGILYVSYKYGDEEVTRDGRLFSNYNEKSVVTLFSEQSWSVVEVWITSDVRPGRESERWVNAIVRKN